MSEQPTRLELVRDKRILTDEQLANVLDPMAMAGVRPPV